MKIYLDTSVYNRPFDDQSQPRIWLETLAFAVILQMIEAGTVELVVSAVLDYENSRNPIALRRGWVDRCLKLSKRYQRVEETIRQRAETLENSGFKGLDALHLACAESADCSYFITSDDRVIRRFQSGVLQVCNPVDFVIAITGEQR
jgi:predicted nucleic acid-binding protein